MTATAAPQKTYLNWGNKIGYGSGDVAGNVVYAFLSAFLMIYLTDQTGLAGNVLQGRRGLGRGEVREEWGHARPAPIVAQPAGPELLEKYRVDAETFRFDITLIPTIEQ